MHLFSATLSHPLVFEFGLLLGALFGFYGPKLVAPNTTLGRFFRGVPTIKVG